MKPKKRWLARFSSAEYARHGLAPDQTKLVILTTQMDVETVDLPARKMTSHFSLSDEKSRPRHRSLRRYQHRRRSHGPVPLRNSARVRARNRLLPHGTGAVRRNRPAGQEDRENILFSLRTWIRAFGFGASYKVSPDGKLLYVFQEDVLVFDLATFTQIDRIELAKPEFPGASPFHLNPADDPYSFGQVVTSVFTAVDPIVHKGPSALRRSIFRPIRLTSSDRAGSCR